MLCSLTNRIEAWVNRVLPPGARENLQQHLVVFATVHPVLATFVLLHIVFSGMPLILFVLLAVGVLVFSLVLAFMVALLSALLFTIFCVGVALVFLIPTLFVTTSLAIGVWLWAWGAYFTIAWFGARDTEQLTRLSAAVASYFLDRPDTKDGLGNEHVVKEESVSDLPHGADCDPRHRPAGKPEARQKDDSGMKTSPNN